MYTLMYIPKSGLFYDGGVFLDGRQQRVSWDRTIHVYETQSQAQVAQQKVIDRYPDAKGEVVVLRLEGLKRHDEGGGRGERGEE